MVPVVIDSEILVVAVLIHPIQSGDNIIAKSRVAVQRIVGGGSGIAAPGRRIGQGHRSNPVILVDDLGRYRGAGQIAPQRAGIDPVLAGLKRIPISGALFILNRADGQGDLVGNVRILDIGGGAAGKHVFPFLPKRIEFIGGLRHRQGTP
ncbi:hypothetical protein D3C81_947310 [compost metagenome]